MISNIIKIAINRKFSKIKKHKTFAQLFLYCFLALVVTACNTTNSKKNKNIVELTKELVANADNKNIKVEKTLLQAPLVEKNKVYNVTKNVISAKPLMVGDVLYLVDQKSMLYAYDTKNYKLIWSNNLSSSYSKTHSNAYIGGGIEYNNDKLYVTNGSRFLIIIDAKTGHELSRKEFPDIIRVKPVLLQDNLVVVQTISNEVYAYDTLNFKILWEHQGRLESIAYNIYVEPIVYKDNLIITYNSGQIFSLNYKTGEITWMFELDNSIQQTSLPNFEPWVVLAQPIVEHDNLYIATSSNKLFKLNIRSGETIWEVDASDVQNMGLFGDNLVLVNNGRQVAIINSHNGQIKWTGILEKADKQGQQLNKSRASIFMKPFFSRSLNKSNEAILNIIANNGELYQFEIDQHGDIAKLPKVKNFAKYAKYLELVDQHCYIVTEQQVIKLN